MKYVGIAFIVVGILGFAVTGISFTTSEKIVDVGPLEIEKEEERSLPVSPLAAGGAVIMGIGLVAVSRR